MEKGMYVRCPIDELENPRSFVTGQIIEADDFSEQVKVKFHDPFHFRSLYDYIPENAAFKYANVQRCTIYRDSLVLYKGKRYKIISLKKEDDWFYYVLQGEYSGEICRAREDSITVSFIMGRVSPLVQMRNYEFQNPVWYFGRQIVSKTTKVLENSVFGFKELAGCKIFLLPHQLKTIMRCLQENECRYMLADEVGMGKTIEAASILKVYMLHNTNKRILLAVPRPLVAQWRTELFIKFEIIPGEDANSNYLELIAEDEVSRYSDEHWDFIVADEAHKLLASRNLYEIFHALSRRAQNILLLSATPIQQKGSEYLALLKLILPEKYDRFSDESFAELVEKQKGITKSTYLVLQDFDDYQTELEEAISADEDPADNEDCTDLFDDVESGLKKINKLLNDETYMSIVSEADFDSEDHAKSKIQEALLYICDNYQLEKNIIRNRRRYMTDLPQRTLAELSYDLDAERNTYEYTTYEAMVDWITRQDLPSDVFRKNYIPLLTAMFSSAAAFSAELKEQNDVGLTIDEQVEDNAKEWLLSENKLIEDIDAVLEEPYKYSSRILEVVDYIDQETYGHKVVLFTSRAETFQIYRYVLTKYFGEEYVSFFSKGMSEDDLELNVYRFQNDSSCQLLLCDETGGEGRNLQGADFVIHIDLPWDANAIEQRIGRLDRLGRDASKDVCSVVVHTKETLEEELFKFWDQGLNIFKQSLSGLEIIMGEISESIIKAVTTDFRYGLSGAIAEIIESSQKMEQEVREEQHFDTAAFTYATINQRLTLLLKYYSENENELFANTMLSWAALAGLKGSVNKNGVAHFGETSFSIRSAENSLLIPPNWAAYMKKSSNAFNQRIQELYEERMGTKPNNAQRDIVGTFRRDVAIKNDYLHFFAPGDEIFDCIISNAMNSYRGTCSAIGIDADFDWKGVVFTWILRPNEQLLLERGIPLTALRQYKSYISVDQLTTPVSFPEYEDVNPERVLKLLESIAVQPFSDIKDTAIHLGRRSPKNDAFGIRIRLGCANLDWFKTTYRPDNWRKFLNDAVAQAKEVAKKQFSMGRSLKTARADMDRILSAEIAQAKYYGVDPGEVDRKKETYDTCLEALRTSTFEMESAAFVWVRGK